MRFCTLLILFCVGQQFCTMRGSQDCPLQDFVSLPFCTVCSFSLSCLQGTVGGVCGRVAVGLRQLAPSYLQYYV